MTAEPYGAMREALQRYFAEGVVGDPIHVAEAKLQWRVSCFRAGLDYADLIERRFFPLKGRSVLDPACAWGGHAVAFAARGAQVAAAEYIDHDFTRLAQFCATHQLTVDLCRSDCERLPFRAETFDVVLALELIEHIASVERFARELTRVLRPGGVCLLSTPARLRSAIEGEPHYGLRGLALLPFRCQGWVARRLFQRSYPYPVVRQYSRASQVLSVFQAQGLTGQAEMQGALASRLRSIPPLKRFADSTLWSVILLRKGSAPEVHQQQ